MKPSSLLRRALRLAAVALPLLAATPGGRAQSTPLPPERMAYQSYLVDGNGNPLGVPTPQNYDIVFRIYDDASAGTVLWAEQQTVTVDQGQFSVLLGDGGAYASEPQPALSSVFFTSTASDRYVEMTVRGIGASGGDAPLLPRVRLLPSPYAFLSRHARTAGQLVNSTNGTVLTVSGTKVGINQAAPASALDVGGTVTATGLEVKGDAMVSGKVKAGTVAGFGTIPLGGIIMWSGSDAEVPTGWALCTGQKVNGRSTPDLRGRFVLGTGTGKGLTERKIDQTGGEESHVLTVAELPAHTHLVDPPPATTASGGSHTHTYYSGAGSTAGIKSGSFNAGEIGYQKMSNTTTENGSHAHSVDLPAFNSATRGGGQGHNNLPPFYVLAFIMRVQ